MFKRNSEMYVRCGGIPLCTLHIYRVVCQSFPTYETKLFHPNSSYETNACFVQSSSMKPKQVSSDITIVCRLPIISNNWSQSSPNEIN